MKDLDELKSSGMHKGFLLSKQPSRRCPRKQNPPFGKHSWSKHTFVTGFEESDPSGKSCKKRILKFRSCISEIWL